MSQSPFSQVFRKGLSLTQGGRSSATEEKPPAPSSTPKSSDRAASSAKRVNIVYLVGDARETKFVSGAFDKAYPHLNLDFSVPLDDARSRLGEAGRYDVLVVGWSVPEADALSLIGYVREQNYPLAIVAACEQSPERYRQAGADECAQKGGSFLARLPNAIDEALKSRGTPAAGTAAASAPPSQPLRVAYSGDVEFVKTALKNEFSALQVIPIADAMQGTACDVVLLDHTPAANTAMTLAEVRGRNLDVPIVLLFNQPDEAPVLRTFASDINDFIVKTPGWATRLPLRLEIANTRYQQIRELATLRVKEARLRTLVDNLPAAIVRLSPEGTVLALNAVALSLLGAAESRQLLRKQFYSLINPTDRDNCSDFITRVCGGEQRSIEVAATTLSGDARAIQISAIPVAAESGGVSSALMVLRDVTDRKRLEVAVEKASVVPPAEPEPIPEIPTIAEIERFGSTETEEPEKLYRTEEPAPAPALAAPPAPVAAPVAAATTDPGALRALEADLQRLSSRARAAFEELEASLRDAEARHEAVTTRQLEEHAKLEAAQLERWRSYDAFVQRAAHGIFHATLAADLLDVNPAFATALGYETPDDLIAQGTSIGRLTAEAGWRETVERWRQGQHDAVDARWKRNDGSLVSFRLHGRIVGGPQGDVERLEVIAENVTAQRALETELRRARRWEEIARVTTGIAADLKHVVSTLNESTNHYLATLELDEADRAEIVPIQHGASKALALSRQLIAYGRKGSRTPEALDLNAVVRDLESVVRRVTDEHIELSLAPAAQVATVRADQPTVEEALVNLAVAAGDALPAGGRIDITTESVDVERHGVGHPVGLEPGAYAVLSVTAAGWGIDEEAQERLSRTPLAPVTRALSKLGGSLKVESVAGESLTFSVYLPHVQTPEAVEG